MTDEQINNIKASILKDAAECLSVLLSASCYSTDREYILGRGLINLLNSKIEEYELNSKIEEYELNSEIEELD